LESWRQRALCDQVEAAYFQFETRNCGRRVAWKSNKRVL
jgi:hypothetical protein